MITPRRYLHQVLDTSLDAAALYRIGPVQSAWNEGGEACFKAALFRQQPGPGEEQFNPQSEAGEVFIRLRAVSDEIMRVKISRAWSTFADSSPMLQLHASLETQVLHVQDKGDGWLVTSPGKERAWLDRGDFAPHISPDGERWVFFQRDDHFFAGQWDALPCCFVDTPAEKRAAFALTIQPGEHFCGTGERFDRIDLFGRQFELINADALGVNNKRAYKNIPFLLSSRPYGLFVHSHAVQRLDIGSHSTRSLQWMTEDGDLDLFFIGGRSPSRILYNYRRLTGFPALPPAWSFGAWMSRMTYYSDEQASGIAGRLRAEGYPMDVIHLDTGWFDREWICDWKFSSERFPDPANFFERMKARGFHVSLWQYPYIHRESSLVTEAVDSGMVGRETEDSQPAGLGLTLDFTNPNTAQWYSEKLLAPLFAMGAAAIKTDFGEEVDEGAVYASGMSGRKYHNLFALLYQKAAYEATCRALGIEDTVIWARSAWAGSQRYPVHWGGDSACTFDGLAGSLCGGLHLGLSGFAFWSHDVGGFHGVPDFMNNKPSDRLYLRWVQMGVFSSHMRFHGSTPREPWEYPGTSPMVREWLRFRYALLPYILAEAKKCTESGLPMLRSLVIDWPNDPAIWSISDEYLFGDSFLVCPVLSEHRGRPVYLPDGEWLDFWTGRPLLGPQMLPPFDLSYSRMPLFVRFGSEIEFAEPVQHTGQLDRARRFTLKFDETYQGFEGTELSRWVRI